MIRGVLMALALGTALIGAANAQTANTQPDLVKRGDYLVNTIMTCGNCHSPKGPPSAVAGKEFTGGPPFDLPPFKVTPSNITQDKETGIGGWSDADIKKLMRTGEMRNGVHIAMIMPTGFYHIMTDRDLDAVVAYLRTIKPIKNTVAAPVYKMPQVEHVLPGAEKKYTEAMFSDRQKHGFYLATIAHCMECHTPMEKGVRQWGTRLGAGGFDFPGPWGVSTSRNITQSKTKGIGAWTDAEIKRAITTGVSRDGSHLKPPMGFHYYATVTDDDLNDIVAYLRTVPAKE